MLVDNSPEFETGKDWFWWISCNHTWIVKHLPYTMYYMISIGFCMRSSSDSKNREKWFNIKMKFIGHSIYKVPLVIPLNKKKGKKKQNFFRKYFRFQFFNFFFRSVLLFLFSPNSLVLFSLILYAIFSVLFYSQAINHILKDNQIVKKSRERELKCCIPPNQKKNERQNHSNFSRYNCAISI